MVLKSICVKAFRFLISLFLVVGFSVSVNAQDDPPDDPPDDPRDTPVDPDAISSQNSIIAPVIEWEKRQNAEERLTVFGNDLLGEGIDPHTGGISFEHLDVSIPGNSSLEVAIRRRRSQGDLYHDSVDTEFGDWELVVPRIKVVTAGNWTDNRCTASYSSNFPIITTNTSGGSLFASSYSNGVILDVPGAGQQQILENKQGAQWPSAAKYVTKDNWYLTCINNASDGEEGFIANAPNGDSYRFDKVIVHRARDLGYIDANPLRRNSYTLAASQVTDVHGNIVNYDYVQGVNGLRLAEIHSNDGRSITLDYHPSKDLIKSVTSNERSWDYEYTRSNHRLPFWLDVQGRQVDNQVLKTVTQPDSQFWEFTLDGMSIQARPYDACGNSFTSRILTVKHPYGMVGTFTLEEKPHRHFLGNAIRRDPFYCPMAEDTPSGGPNPPIHPLVDETEVRIMSIISKRLSGPNTTPAEWTYQYEEDTGASGSSENDQTNWTKVTYPDGFITTYKHVWSRGTTDINGKLVSLEKQINGIESEKTTYTYVTEAGVGSTFMNVNARYAILPDVTTVELDGDIYTTNLDYNSNYNLSNYSFGNPTQTRISSNVSPTPRSIVTEYDHNTTNWVLGLPLTVTQNNLLLVTNEYDSLGRKTLEDRFGEITRYQYHTAQGWQSLIFSITDNIGRVTELRNWKRGTPQTIRLPLRPAFVYNFQFVDDNGWLTRSLNARNLTTVYTRDDMGRLTKFDPPGTYFADTSIDFNFPFGGGATQTITKGSGKTTISYDGFFRPILEKTEAIDTGWVSYVRTEYDGLGRVTFKSQPSASSLETNGTDFTYDGLGRLYDETENFGQSVKTEHRYASNHRYEVTDPIGTKTFYSRQGYDGREGKDYVKIEIADNQMSQTTDITRDIHGKITHVNQYGAGHDFTGANQTQEFYYNAQQRLCRQLTPEHGVTRYQYDGVGQMTGYIKGLEHSHSNCGNLSNSANVVRLEYDEMGRLLKTNFIDGSTPDITRTYDNNGNVKTVTRNNGTAWAYNYNSQDLITSERLTVDNELFKIESFYNPSGHLRAVRMPTNRLVSTVPDGLGRVRNKTVPGTSLINNAQYHPSGALSSMYYQSSNYTVTQMLNDRLLPYHLKSEHSVNTAMDLQYVYDARGKITSIMDNVVTNNNRTYSYDALGRLDTATGPFGASGNSGTASYEYDALNNLRVKTEGSRTVNLTYDANNRLVTSVDTGATGTRSLLYDNRGNVRKLGSLTMTYDKSDQPVSLSGTANGVGAASGSHVYDGNLKRVKSVVNGQTIYNVYDISGKLIHVKSGNDETDYIDGPLGPLARIKNDEVTWIHPDHLGSAQAGTLRHQSTPGGQPGAVTFREQYTPFGSEIVGNAANDNQAGFTGHIKDKATGLNYMQARYYDPVIGRFLSVDPVTFLDTGDANQFNRYAYGNNDPVNMIDPNGADALSITFDVDLVGIPIGQGLAPIGGGFSAGIVVGAEPKLPTLTSITQGILSNPGNITNALIDSVTDSIEVGVVGAVRASTGLDLSAGVAIEYTDGSASDFNGPSTQLEGGLGPAAVSVSKVGSPLSDDGGFTTPERTIGVEFGASSLPASGTISFEASKALILDENR